MNNEENAFIKIINEKSIFKPDFDKVKVRIEAKNQKKHSHFFINLLLSCESLAFVFCLFMTIKISLKPENEGLDDKTNIIYLLLSLSFIFILLVTFIIKSIIKKNQKKGGTQK